MEVLVVRVQRRGWILPLALVLCCIAIVPWPAPRALAQDLTLRNLSDMRGHASPRLYLTRTDRIARTRAVGETDAFWTRDESNGFSQVQATLAHVGSSDYVYVTGGVQLDAAMAQRISGEFDTVIYPRVRGSFGSEPNPGIDGDSRITILLVDDSGQVDGYFDPRNLFHMDKSNEREMLVLNVHGLLAQGADLERSFRQLASTAAHEFQHMVHYAADPAEELWVTEGLSQYAEFLIYGEASRLPYFRANPSVSLTEWSWSLESYGASFSFILYLAEHYSTGGLLSRFVAQEAHGIGGVDAYLSETYPGVTFEDVFRDWTVANYLDDNSMGDGRYGYTEGGVGVSPVVTSGYPDGGSLALPPWSAAYVTLAGDAPRKLKLNLIMASGVTRPSISCVYRNDSGEVKVEDISGRGDGAGAWFADLPDTSSPVTLVVRSAGRAEPGLAYAVDTYHRDHGKVAATAFVVAAMAATVLLRGAKG